MVLRMSWHRFAPRPAVTVRVQPPCHFGPCGRVEAKMAEGGQDRTLEVDPDCRPAGRCPGRRARSGYSAAKRARIGPSVGRGVGSVSPPWARARNPKGATRGGCRGERCRAPRDDAMGKTVTPEAQDPRPGAPRLVHCDRRRSPRTTGGIPAGLRESWGAQEAGHPERLRPLRGVLGAGLRRGHARARRLVRGGPAARLNRGRCRARTRGHGRSFATRFRSPGQFLAGGSGKASCRFRLSMPHSMRPRFDRREGVDSRRHSMRPVARARNWIGHLPRRFVKRCDRPAIRLTCGIDTSQVWVSLEVD